MDTVKIASALSNTTRMEIMRWLSNPNAHFTPHLLLEGFEIGVCVGKIHEKSGLSQSTISHYLSILQNAELLVTTRIGKWTYYRTNKITIDQYVTTLKSEIQNDKH